MTTTSAGTAEPAGAASAAGRMTIGEIIGAFATGEPPLRIEAYDGSAIGPADSRLVLRLKSEKALQYFVTAPGDLGLARAYLMGELEIDGVHPGAPHDVFGALEMSLRHGSAIASAAGYTGYLGNNFCFFQWKCRFKYIIYRFYICYKIILFN